MGPPVLPPPPPDTLNRHTNDRRGIIARSSAIVRDQRGAKELSCQERQSFSTILQPLCSSRCLQEQLCSCPDTAESTDVFLDAQQLGGSDGVGGDECGNGSCTSGNLVRATIHQVSTREITLVMCLAVIVLNHPFVGCFVSRFEDLVRNFFQHTKGLLEFGQDLVVIIIFEGKFVTGIVSRKHLAATGKLGRSEGRSDRRSNDGREEEEGGRSHTDEIGKMHVEGGLLYFFANGLQALWIGWFEKCLWKIVSGLSA
jgi:hypothetical protein